MRREQSVSSVLPATKERYVITHIIVTTKVPGMHNQARGKYAKYVVDFHNILLLYYTLFILREQSEGALVVYYVIGTIT